MSMWISENIIKYTGQSFKARRRPHRERAAERANLSQTTFAAKIRGNFVANSRKENAAELDVTSGRALAREYRLVAHERVPDSPRPPVI